MEIKLSNGKTVPVIVQNFGFDLDKYFKEAFRLMAIGKKTKKFRIRKKLKHRIEAL